MNALTVWSRGIVVCIAMAACAVALPGCNGQQRGRDGTQVIRRDRTPTYAEVVTPYNARVRDLAGLRAAATLVIETKGADGKRSKEQVEGFLQMVRPRQVSLRLDKVGQTIFVLGSNDSNYWWIDLTEGAKALVGRHDGPGVFAPDVDVPVHPMDMMELLAVTPLPVEPIGAKPPKWSQDGRLLWITLPGANRVPGRQYGSRRYGLDPEQNWAPVRVELVDAQGTLAVWSDLTRYEPVRVDMSARAAGFDEAAPRMATRVEITVPRLNVTTLMALFNPENPGTKMRMRSFDLEALVQAYGVKEVFDLDAPKPREGDAEPQGGEQ